MERRGERENGRRPWNTMMATSIPPANKSREAVELAWIWEGARSSQMERPEGFTKPFLQ